MMSDGIKSGVNCILLYVKQLVESLVYDGFLVGGEILEFTHSRRQLAVVYSESSACTDIVALHIVPRLDVLYSGMIVPGYGGQRFSVFDFVLVPPPKLRVSYSVRMSLPDRDLPMR